MDVLDNTLGNKNKRNEKNIQVLRKKIVYLKNMEKDSNPFYSFLKFNFIYLVVIVFFVKFIQNDFAFAEKESQKCLEFINPKNFKELQELRLCIKKIKTDKSDEKESRIIRSSYEGSITYYEKLNYFFGKKASKILSEKNED